MEGLESDAQALSFNSLLAHIGRRNLGAVIKDGFLRTPSGGYSNLALILSDQCPWRFEISTREGMVRTVGGSLVDQLPEAEKAAMQVRRALAEENGSELPKLPGLVLSEALLNAATHRSYCSAQPTRIEVGLDEVRVWSPGGMVRIGNSFRDRTRNPMLAEILQELGFKNSLVRGIPGIIQSYRSC